MLDSAEAARRLGVKVSTLYAYVSRGVLPSYPAPDRRRSLFALEDIERLAHRARGGRQVETRLATVTTAVTQLTERGPLYRGVPAVDLANRSGFEAVAELLWESEPGPWDPVPVGRPPGPSPAVVLPWSAVMAGAADPLRADRQPAAVARAGRRVVATMVRATSRAAGRIDEDAELFDQGAGHAGSGPADEAAIADRLVHGLLGPSAPEAVVRAVDAALVLLADHELATSTLAVRVAASTRADCCDAVLAGLGTIAGPLHGGASGQAYALLVDAAAKGAGPALHDALRWHGLVPGFGHALYAGGDPRAAALLEHVDVLATEDHRRVLEDVRALVVEQGDVAPNVDFALAGLALATGMGPNAGSIIFAVARTAGWIAHYLEELHERPLRFRARAVYAAPSVPH